MGFYFYVCMSRGEKGNKHAQVLAVCQAPSLKKNGRNFVDHANQVINRVGKITVLGLGKGFGK